MQTYHREKTSLLYRVRSMVIKPQGKRRPGCADFVIFPAAVTFYTNSLEQSCENGSRNLTFKEYILLPFGSRVYIKCMLAGKTTGWIFAESRSIYCHEAVPRFQGTISKTCSDCSKASQVPSNANTLIG